PIYVRHRVQALLRTQRGDPAAIAVHVNDALIGDPVRALPVGGALEHEAVTTQFQTVARLHAQVTLAVEQTGTDHTDRTYRDADMGHHHAPVTARQRADAAHQTLVAGLVEDVACRTADHPQHQEQHA